MSRPEDLVYPPNLSEAEKRLYAQSVGAMDIQDEMDNRFDQEVRYPTGLGLFAQKEHDSYTSPDGYSGGKSEKFNRNYHHLKQQAQEYMQQRTTSLRDYMGDATSDVIDMRKVKIAYPPDQKTGERWSKKREWSYAGVHIGNYETAKELEKNIKKEGGRFNGELESDDIVLFAQYPDSDRNDGLTLGTLAHEFGHISDYEKRPELRTRGLSKEDHEYVYIRNAFRDATAEGWDDTVRSYAYFIQADPDNDEEYARAEAALRQKVETNLPRLQEEEASAGYARQTARIPIEDDSSYTGLLNEAPDPSSREFYQQNTEDAYNQRQESLLGQY